MVSCIKRLAIILIAMLSMAISLNAQILEPVKWNFSSEHVDGKDYLVFKADIDDGWYVYSQYLKSEDGPIKTEITYDNPPSKLVGKAVESGDKVEGFDSVFKMDVTKYKKKLTIKQQVIFDGNKPAVGYLTFMTCNNEKCLNPTDLDFSIFKKAVRPASSSIEPQTEVNNLEQTTDKLQQTSKVVNQTKEAITPVKSELSTSATQQQNLPSKAVQSKEQADVETKEKDTQAILTPVTWSFEVRDIDATTKEVIAKASILKGWTIYDQEVAEGGPIPTSFAFAESPNYELIEKPIADGKKKSGFDKNFKIDVTKWLAPQATFTQKVKLNEPNTLFAGYLEFMTCDDTRCLAPSEVPFLVDFTNNTAKIIDFDQFDKISEDLKKGANKSQVSSTTNTNTKGSGDILSTYKIDNSKDKVTCGADNRETNVGENDGWLTIFLLGFGGGLLALLTPCVFPMIPLTVSFFTGKGKDRKTGIQKALLYGASIIGIYVTLGLLITMVFGADALNQLSTNVWFNLAFGILFIVFAFSFFGFFEITLPSSWANKSDRAADKGGNLGIFFMAFTLSLVSFSCTGPIIGTLLVETATGGGATILGRIPVAPLIGMLGFSSALALPFTLFAAFPTALNALPKSGGWMNTVKATLGFVEIALALKFFSTADLIAGTKLMPYELFLGIWVLVGLAMAAYYFGWLKTPLEKYGANKRTVPLMIMGAIAFLFTAYLATGFSYNKISETFSTPFVLSGLAPPAGHSYIYPKHCPQNLNCYKDYDEGIAEAKRTGKPVFLDFTGNGCVNCRKMEDNVWGQPGVYEQIKDDYILISLYVDDRKKLEQPFISDYSGRKLRTVGSKWADFQARYFDRNSQPYYVLMTADGKVLNKPVAYTPDVNKFAEFLRCGTTQFKEL